MVNLKPVLISNTQDITTLTTDNEEKSVLFNKKNAEKTKEIINYLTLCGWVLVNQPQSLYINPASKNNKEHNEVYWHSWNWWPRSTHEHEPDYYGLFLSINKNTWKAVQSLKILYKIKEYSTITEQCISGIASSDYYFVRIQNEEK